MRRRWKKIVFWGLLLGFVVINGLAYMQAKAMISFSDSGEATKKPEDLSFVEKIPVLLTGITLPRPVNQRTPQDVGVSYETVQLANGQGETLDAWVIEVDEPQAVVLLFHGYAASKAQLLEMGRALHAMQCNVMLTDFYGSGESSGTGTTIGYKEALDVKACATYANERWRDVDVPHVYYGISMGGAAILKAIDDGAIEPNAIALESVFDTLLNTASNRFRMMGLPPFPLAQMLIFWGGVQSGYNGFAYKPAEYARAVACPALVLHGANDERVREEQAQRVYENLNEWKSFSLFESAAHALVMQTDPEQWQEAMEELLEKAGTQRKD
ncbi:MAG: prolyl oligopeptidase family serine peptidase [Candidatus Eisenbacteria bacterium]|uniref:Prolyl oligopeptidase family serine peptidase n=1 Tax=Eiseniibacteriota bacterium TaxID=2212470 RepID=A0A7Y2E625_UNCEI|nr:prolyl oligopeptidase family serine peptidase [Candidatus Eisenbacteria bacterium]